MNTRTLTLGSSSYPVTLPSLRDSRLHVAMVVITIHVLGQTTLHFQVSVPQILAAILTCAVIEISVTFHRTKAFIWPASAMLTGSGVALILRVPSTPPGDHWTTHAWWVFSGVAALSLATKYLIRYRGSHVFNPSNIGLVAVFVLLGSTRVEPLDFWWAPLDVGMVIAYAVILAGGLLITARLGLLSTAISFWLTLVAGTALLAASGHCMIARWAFSPVCDFDYWRAIVTSPEVLIFLFFMITDPKTVPTGRTARVVFGVVVGATSVLLMAPQTNEFGTKVALLGGLAIVCAIRPFVDRWVPDPRGAIDRVLRSPERPAALSRLVVPAGLFTATVLVLGAAIVAAGAPARGEVAPSAADVLGRVPHDVDASTFPDITVDQDVLDWNHEITGAGAREIVLTLAENLLLENQGLLRADPQILEAVDHGDRLDDMKGRVEQAKATGQTVVERYRIDDVHVTLLVPFGRQDGLSLGLESRGTTTTETYGVDGQLLSRETSPLATTFVMRRATGARWLNVAVRSLDA